MATPRTVNGTVLFGQSVRIGSISASPPPPPPPPPSGAPALTVTLPSPASGEINVPSGPFTITGTDLPTGTTTVSIARSPSGTLSTPGLALTQGSPSGQFTLTPIAAGTHTLSFSNDRGITNPAAVQFLATGGASPPPPTPASAFILSGPTSGITGNDAAYQVAPNGPLAVAATVFIAAPGASLSVATLSFAAGATSAQSFAVQRSTDGTTQVAISNSAGLNNSGSPINYTSVAPSAITLESRPVNIGNLVQFYQWSSATRYERFVRNIFLSNTNPALNNDIQITANCHIPNVDTFLLGTYELLVKIDGEGAPIVVSSMTITTLTERQKFPPVNLNAIPNGWHLFDIRRTDAQDDGSTFVPYWMYVGASTAQTWAPTQGGSWGIIHEEGPTIRWGKMPVVLDPPTFTLPSRTATPFATAADRGDLFRRNLSPTINGDPPYLRAIAHPDGGKVMTCLNHHGYNFNVFTAEQPKTILRDGPFGVGLISGATHLHVGRRGGVYFTDSWSVGHLYADGHIERLVGYRHTLDGQVLVGDWSAIPEARRGFNLLWGMAWRPSTISQANLDTSRTVDRGDGTLENPHNAPGPQLFVTDSLRLNVNGRPGRVCRIQFSKDNHAAVPVVTEFILDAHNAWDVVCTDDDKLLVSERRAHRIAMYSAVTGAYIRTIIETANGDNYAIVSEDDTPVRLTSVATIRTQACVLPEGLFLQDGWLYFGSIAMGQIKKIDLSTLDAPGGPTVVVVVESTFDRDSEYIKIALSDGTFGPRGTIFAVSWDKVKNSLPWAWLPNGTPWALNVPGSTSNNQGLAGSNGFTAEGYNTAVAAANGRLIVATADYGLVELTLGQDGDQTLDEDIYSAGKSEYERTLGKRMTHGVAGFRQWQSAQLPSRGVSAALDYYLDQNGHTNRP